MFFSLRPRVAGVPARERCPRGNDAASAGSLTARSRGWLWGVAFLLGLQAVGIFALGSWSAWLLQTDIDMRLRAAEYTLFRDGIYPNAHLEAPPAPHTHVYTVYPPYAFPMFAIFFEPGGVVQGRFLIEALSLASFVLMGLFGRSVLTPYGMPLAAIGGLVSAAIAGNCNALRIGQFSIICTGLIVAQIMMLARGRPAAAGACWAFAMIKPQIALPFLLLFFVGRHLSGLLTGVGLLVVLTLFASTWTGVSTAEIFTHWTRDMSLGFTEHGQNIGPGIIAKALHIDHRIMQMVALAVLAALAVPVVRFTQRLGQPAMLPVAGFCAVAGMFFCYHRQYDNVMLFPAVIALIEVAASTRRPLTVFLTVAMVLLLLTPQKLLEFVPSSAWLQSAVWLAAGLLPFRGRNHSFDG